MDEFECDRNFESIFEADSSAIENFMEENIEGRNIDLEANTDCINFLKQKLELANSTIESFEKGRGLDMKERETLRNEKLTAIEKFEQIKCEMVDLMKKYKALQEDKAKESRQRHKLEDEAKELRLNLAEEEQRNLKAEGNLREIDEEVKHLYFEKLQMEKEAQDNSTWLSSVEEYSKELTKLKDVYKAKSDLLENKLVENVSKMEKLEVIAKEHFHETNEQKTEILDLNDDVERIFLELQGFHHNYGRMIENLQDLKEIIYNTKDELSDEACMLAKALEKFKHDCKDFKTKNQELEIRFKNLHEKKIEIDNALVKTQDEICSKESEIKMLNEGIDGMKKELSNERSKLSSQGQEIEDLKELCEAERSRREGLEMWLERKELEMEQLQKQNEESRRQLKTAETKLYSEQNLCKELKIENSKLREEKGISAFKLETLEQQYKKTKTEVVDFEDRLRSSLSCQERCEGKIEELSRIVSKNEAENEELTTKCESNGMLINDYEAKLHSLDQEREDLKEQLWLSRNKNIETEAALMNSEETVSRVKAKNSAISHEKEQVLRKVIDVEDSRKTSEEKIKDLERLLMQKGFTGKSLEATIKRLEDSLRKVKEERNDILKRVTDQDKTHEEERKQIRKRFEDTFSAKDSELEKQASKKEVLQIFLKKMDEQLKQKESQLEVKREELRSVLARLSDIRNDKDRCSRKVESLQMTEKSLSSKVQILEKSVISLEQKEIDLTRQLNLRKNEIKTINMTWTRTTAAALEAIGQELCRASEC